MADGNRTRDHLDHNQVLYQLSYSHHGRPALRRTDEESSRSGRVVGQRRQTRGRDPFRPVGLPRRAGSRLGALGDGVGEPLE